MAPRNKRPPASLLTVAAAHCARNIIIGEAREKCSSEQDAIASSPMGATHWHCGVFEVVECCIQGDGHRLEYDAEDCFFEHSTSQGAPGCGVLVGFAARNKQKSVVLRD